MRGYVRALHRQPRPAAQPPRPARRHAVAAPTTWPGSCTSRCTRRGRRPVRRPAWCCCSTRPAACWSRSARSARCPGRRTLAGLRLALGDGLLGTVADERRAGARPDHGRLRPGARRAARHHVRGRAVRRPRTGDDRWRRADRAGAAGPRAVRPARPGRFDETDVSTLTTFAAQAAIALDNVRLHEEAQRLSLTDPLTGLFNYRYLRESLRRELERAARFGRTLAVAGARPRPLQGRQRHLRPRRRRRGAGRGRPPDPGRDPGGRRRVPARRRGVRDPAAGDRRGRRRGAGPPAGRRGAATRRCAPATTRSASRSRSGWPCIPEHGATGSAVLEAADSALYAAKAAGRDACRTADDAARRASRSPLGAPRYLSAPSVPVTGASRGTQPTQRALAVSLSGMPQDHDARPSSQGCHPRRRPRHPFPAGDQGGAQGTAAGGRPAGPAVHRGGGRRRRYHDVLLITGRGKTAMVDHFDRRPDLEQRLEEKGDDERLAAVKPAERTGRDLHLPAGRAARASGTRCPTPSRTSATSRSPCCSATSSWTTSRCSSRCSTCRPAPAASCSRCWRCAPEEVSRYGIAR